MHYNVIIIGGGPGGIFSAYELTKDRSDLRVAVFEAGHSLEKRHCPIDGDKVKSCIRCKSLRRRGHEALLHRRHEVQKALHPE